MNISLKFNLSYPCTPLDNTQFSCYADDADFADFAADAADADFKKYGILADSFSL